MVLHINSDTTYRKKKPTTEDDLIHDGGGLYMLIKANGTKRWIFRYRFNGKPNNLGFGEYPATTLENARDKAADARTQIANGIDPGQKKKQVKLEKKIQTEHIDNGLPIPGSFKDIALQWMNSFAHETQNPTTQKKKLSRLERMVFDKIGNELIKDLKSPAIWALFKPLVEQKKLSTAHRLLSEISAIFQYAIVHGLCDYDVSRPVLKQLPAEKVKHRAAIVDPKKLGDLLRAIHGYEGTQVVQAAFKISALLFQRPGEIRKMLWADVHLKEKEWRPHISKTNIDHVVPLSRQAIEILEEMKLLNASPVYVFPSRRDPDRPMSENTIRSALMSLGYDGETMTAHGFRGTASTLLNEQEVHADAIERQLAHAPRDKTRSSYNQAKHLDLRVEIMQWWADYLDALKNGSTIEPFKKKDSA
jgi:integrase